MDPAGMSGLSPAVASELTQRSLELALFAPT
ncbi:MAG: hypothetical protein QOF40_3597 [Actinomycetota bacterium]|jgi:hypothetical protein|nr:hypothetical protein [Actinomycetota bacterium]